MIREQIALLPRLRAFKPGGLDIFSIGREKLYFRKTPLCRSLRMVIRTVFRNFLMNSNSIAPITGRSARVGLVHRLANNGDVVAFKMGRRQGARREHISIDT